MALACVDAETPAALHPHAGDLEPLVHVDPEALSRRRVAPDDGVVPDDRAWRMVGGTENRMVAAARQVDDRAGLLDLVGPEKDRVDTEGPVQERALALDPERVVRVREPEQAARGKEEIEVELRRETAVEIEARPEERDRLRGLVVGPQNGRVPARAAGADVRALEDCDVTDAVAARKVVRDREPVSAAADHDDVVPWS